MSSGKSRSISLSKSKSRSKSKSKSNSRSKSKSRSNSRSSKKSSNKSNENYIIVDGTSSSGKTKICLFFSKLNYKCIVMDEYTDPATKQFDKTIENKYMDADEKNNLFADVLYGKMVGDALSAKKAILDDIEQEGLLKAFKAAGKEKKVFVLVVYASLKDLARNLNSRRIEGDARGVFAFEQFAQRYIKCIESDPKKIDTVNLDNFITLLKNFKYEFASEEELKTFAMKMFSNMDIKEDEGGDHPIKLRDGFRCDYLLNTTGKTLDNINTELQTVFST